MIMSNPNRSADLPHPIRTAVEHVYGLLVRREYAALSNLTNGVRMSEAEIEQAVREYGRTLQSWPASEQMVIDATATRVPGPRSWAVIARAYTIEEGPSDLSLEMTLVEVGGGNILVEFDDLHVL